jgi:tryptophan synthase alpha chain
VSPLEAAIRAAGRAGRPALAAYVVAGYPSRAAFGGLLAAVAREADVVEIGVPFTDPLADGVTLQAASRVALDGGATLSWILAAVKKARVRAPLVLMSYSNPLLAFGVERAVRDAAAAGVAGLLVPDLPIEENAPLRRACAAFRLALVQMVTPATSGPRLREICRRSEGFVYAVTVAGTTGGSVSPTRALGDYLDRVRAASPVPVLAGFGVRTAAQARALAAHADGIVVGSALAEALARGEEPGAVLRRLRAARTEPEGRPA